MYAIYFRWKVAAGRESDFEHAWLVLTELLREERGGLGSRLHRCADGQYFAYAQWPSEIFWAMQPEPTARMIELRHQMRQCAELVDGPHGGDVVADLLIS
jgi:hypothetical protein